MHGLCYIRDLSSGSDKLELKAIGTKVNWVGECMNHDNPWVILISGWHHFDIRLHLVVKLRIRLGFNACPKIFLKSNF